jgi:hypothetical protein
MTRLPQHARRLRREIAERLAIDLRTLAAVRVGLALCVLADLAIRFPDRIVFFAEAGVLPRDARIGAYGGGVPFAIWDLVAGDPRAITALFAVGGLAAAALALGWRTRIATWTCWLLVHGALIRVPPIATGGDYLLGALLLWGGFLPLGARWSLDARRRPTAATPRAVGGLPAAVLLLQVATMLVFSGAAKLHDPTWRAGDGVEFALRAGFYATPLALGLAEVRALLVPLNALVLAFELGGPLLLLSPWRRDACRVAYVGASIAMHLGFWLCLRVGIFSWVALVGALAFVPGAAWDRLGARLGRAGRAPPAGPAPRLPRAAAALLVALAALTLASSLRIRGLRGGPIGRVTRALGLNQNGWPMFSPTARDHGWFVVVGRTAAGDEVDLHPGAPAPRPVDLGPPPLQAADYPSYRWRKLYFNVRRSPGLRRLYLADRCRTWNRAHRGGDAVLDLTLLYFRERNLEGGALAPAERVVLDRLGCATAGPAPDAGLAPDDAQGE